MHSVSWQCIKKHCCSITAGVAPEAFNTTYRFRLLNTATSLTGTPANSWNITTNSSSGGSGSGGSSSSSTAGSLNSIGTPQAGARRLLQQQPGDDHRLQVTMSVYTLKPQLVWFRLAQPPPTAAASSSGGGSSSSSTDLVTPVLTITARVLLFSVLRLCQQGSLWTATAYRSHPNMTAYCSRSLYPKI